MTLIIDGYNLMHAAGIVGRGVGPGGLERSRLALLNFLAESLEAEAAARTTVVFDARQAPPGLPRMMNYRGLTVRFAAGYESADELIEELIRADARPRKLIVVSADHRLQKAARRRRAKAVDSERWYCDLAHQRAARGVPPPTFVKPSHPGSGEVEFWLRQFADEAESDSLPGDQIFPPGYAEDVEG